MMVGWTRVVEDKMERSKQRWDIFGRLTRLADILNTEGEGKRRIKDDS